MRSSNGPSQWRARRFEGCTAKMLFESSFKNPVPPNTSSRPAWRVESFPDPAWVSWNTWEGFGTSLEQNPHFVRRFSATSRHKGNRIIRSYGAGDGNRTHVRRPGKLATRAAMPKESREAI